TETEGPLRARLLGPAVEIALAAGDVPDARRAAEELRGIATELGSAMLGAQAARALGAVLIAEGDPATALPELRRAFLSFRDLDAHHDCAATRPLIASACRALGDEETAATEERNAAAALASFRAEVGEDRGGGGPVGLTRRELDVLRLMASGKTNRAIGESLFISEKTAASHVSHILTKLGLPTRAAATAYAYENGLIRPAGRRA
ncbi:MAG TPA: LuxR C-terminal-related transcriptional regulator, partial [Acidimicrobiales bacterium]|nr:LuxR C-terminal-related transcriptional regulator [Acidimicrobiales bacterium]